MTAPAQPALRTMGRGTLSRRLVLWMTALVALIAVFLSGLTALSVHRILQGQLDQQLLSASVRLHQDPRGSVPRGTGGPGQTQGLLFYVQGASGIVQRDRTMDEVSAADAEVLNALTVGGGPVTRTLPGLGGYRLLVSNERGGVLVVGLPTAEMDASMTSILLAATLLTLLAIAVALLAARAIVERSLRPLARLARAAHQVSSLELSSGEVAVPVRASASETDPRSEVGQVGLAFNHMLDNVEDALAARQRSETKVRRFVADASHELRNPLAAIRGYAELTRRERDQAPPTTAHALGRIESESERMSRLVEDLLLLARLDSGPTIQPEDTDLAPLLADAVSDARAAGPDHRWTLTLPEHDVIARGEGHRLLQVVANLLANARTHTPAGTLVETALHSADGFAVITVTDDGPGIPPELLPRVFERFTRGDEARARAGGGVQSTGLGLAIVGALVEAHGGRVSVASHPGMTRFTVRIPLARA